MSLTEPAVYVRTGLRRDENQSLVRPHETQAVVDLRNAPCWIAQPAQLALLFLAPAFERGDVGANRAIAGGGRDVLADRARKLDRRRALRRAPRAPRRHAAGEADRRGRRASARRYDGFQAFCLPFSQSAIFSIALFHKPIFGAAPPSASAPRRSRRAFASRRLRRSDARRRAARG